MKLLSCNSGQFSTPTPLLIMNILRREPCLIFLFHTEFAGWTENPQKYLLTCCVWYKIHYAMINMDPHCASMVVFQRKIKLRSDFSVDLAAFNTSKTVLQVPCHLRRRSFLEVCSWVTGGFGHKEGLWCVRNWLRLILVLGWEAFHLSVTHTNTTALKHRMYVSLSLFCFLLWKQSTKHRNHLRKMETYRSFHMKWFDLFFFIYNKHWWQHLDAYLLMTIQRWMWKK